MGPRPPLSTPQRAILAALAVFPALAITLYFLAGDVEALRAPAWASSQPRGAYIATMLVVKGILLAGVGLGAFGIVRGAPAIAYAGAAALGAGGALLLLGGTGVVVWLSAAMFVLAARIAGRHA
ncbi:MAG TPA: hypothetical protein VM582_03655 [Candidatus Thermoplasmatota archaeon]|nr:hypothetical protein [Candidatus Thermoplasmatota archaeon]